MQPDRRIPFSFQHVAFWSGLRGAISLALALIVANSGAFSPHVADTIKFMTFGVVLFTLLFQGTTVGALIRKLGLSSKSTSESDQQRQQAIIYAHQAGRRELEKMGHEGVLFQEMAIAMTDTYEQAIESTSNSLGRHFASHPELEVAMMIAARRDALLAEQSALLDLARRGLTAPEIAHHLIVLVGHLPCGMRVWGRCPASSSSRAGRFPARASATPHPPDNVATAQNPHGDG